MADIYLKVTFEKSLLFLPNILFKNSQDFQLVFLFDCSLFHISTLFLENFNVVTYRKFTCRDM